MTPAKKTCIDCKYGDDGLTPRCGKCLTGKRNGWVFVGKGKYDKLLKEFERREVA